MGSVTRAGKEVRPDALVRFGPIVGRLGFTMASDCDSGRTWFESFDISTPDGLVTMDVKVFEKFVEYVDE